MSDASANTSESQYVPMDAVYADAPAVSDDVSVGDVLRQARSKMGWTLDSAAARTRIKRDYLEALEAMDPRGLPSRAYAIGYLRTYAGVLGLDINAIVEQFKIEAEVETGRAQPKAVIQKRDIKLPRGLLGAVVILGGVGVIAMWYGAQVTSAGALDETPGAPQATMMTPIESVRSGELSVADVWTGLPSVRNNNWLVLTANEPTYLEVRDVSGRILFARDLEPGEIYRAPDERGLTLSTENAGAIQVHSGELELGSLGQAGQIVENLSASEFLISVLPDSEIIGESSRG